eukprot:NODE_13_length_54415_cov_0.522424.p29 type:complete len:248 gc:universal NODE_13_length_54415_cov_0.522424:33571-34314(+)
MNQSYSNYGQQQEYYSQYNSPTVQSPSYPSAENKGYYSPQLRPPVSPHPQHLPSLQQSQHYSMSLPSQLHSPHNFHLQQEVYGSSYDTVGNDMEQVNRTIQVVYEKKRKRRESHNQVERRRRDNINDRIKDLEKLLPISFLPNDPTSKLSKGQILRKSVEYVQHMQQMIAFQKMRSEQLEELLIINGIEVPGFDFKGLSPDTLLNVRPNMRLSDQQEDDDYDAQSTPNEMYTASGNEDQQVFSMSIQ